MGNQTLVSGEVTIVVPMCRLLLRSTTSECVCVGGGGSH